MESDTHMDSTQSRDTAGAFGFRRREILVLVVIAVVVSTASMWQWWERRQAELGRQWAVSDVYVDTLLLASHADTTRPLSVDPPRDVVATVIDINTADARELMRIPGIGPALATRILSSRAADGPYRTIADLQRVRGIGPRTAARMAAWIRFPDSLADSSAGRGEEP